jgi:hypothetical protein
MTITAQLFDGATLEFPDGTSTAVIQSTVKRLTAERQGTTPAGQRRDAMLANIGQAKLGALTLSPERQAQQSQIDATALTDMRDPGAAEAGLWSTLDGMSFGYGDNMVAALASAMDSGLTYDEALAQVRDQMKAGSDARPGLTLAGNIAGGVLSSVGGGVAGLVGKGATIPSKIGLGMLAGGVEGGLAGGGASNADNLLDWAKGTAMGAGIGAGLGGAISGAGQAVKHLAWNPLLSAVGAKSDTKATEMVQRYMRQAGMTPDDIRRATAKAAAEGQPEFVAADAMGVRGQRALGSMSRQPGDYQQAIVDQLDTRQAGQADRIGGFFSDAFGGSSTAKQEQKAAEALRRAEAGILYPAAEDAATPVNLNNVIGKIDELLNRNPILGESALDESAIGRKLLTIRGMLQKGGEQLIDFPRVLAIKSDISTAIFNLKTAGKKVPPQLAQVLGELDDALESASTGYRAANDAYKAASGVVDAFGQGRKANSSSRIKDILDEAAPLSPEARAAYRTGYTDPMLARMESKNHGTNKVAQANLKSPKNTGFIDNFADDPELLKRRIGREDVMFETRRESLGGPDTAKRLAEDAANADMVGPMVSAAATMNPAGIIRVIMDKAMRAGMGSTPATRELVAKALLSPDPEAVLAAGIKKVARNSEARALIEAMLRAVAMKGGAALHQ